MRSIQDIKEELQNAKKEQRELLLREYRDDKRAGVRKLIASGEKREAKLREEISRVEALCAYEKKYGPEHR